MNAGTSIADVALAHDLSPEAVELVLQQVAGTVPVVKTTDPFTRVLPVVDFGEVERSEREFVRCGRPG